MKSRPQRPKTFVAKLGDRAFGEVDIASLAFFRVAFGFLLVWHLAEFFTEDRIRLYWLEPRFLFKYYGFSWVHSWPGAGLYLHFAVLIALAAFLTIGFLYRISAILLFLGYTYSFLLDEARWKNHTYLICLVCFLLILVPANRAWSIDTWLNPRIRRPSTPAWTIWVFRAQMGIVYFFAGVAKLSPDWLRAEPMRVWLIQSHQPPWVDVFLRKTSVFYSFAYAALLFDLFITFFLLWPRTRVAAFCTALAFHLINARLFPLEIFPWLAIAMTTLFLTPGWPRKVVSLFGRKFEPVAVSKTSVSLRRQSLILAGLGIFILVQVLVPLRHFLYRGGVEWFYSEHRFSWRMMTQRSWVNSYFYVTDPNSGQTFQVRPEQYLSISQVQAMNWRPDMILQFAHFLAAIMPRSGPETLRVEARVSVSLDGRKPELIIDPNIDLAAEPRTLGRPRWLLEIHQPLPERRASPSENPFELQLPSVD